MTDKIELTEDDIVLVVDPNLHTKVQINYKNIMYSEAIILKQQILTALEQYHNLKEFVDLPKSSSTSPSDDKSMETLLQYSLRQKRDDALTSRKRELEIISTLKTRKAIGDYFLISERKITMKSRKEFKCSYYACRKVIKKGSILFRNVFFPLGTSIGCCPSHMEKGSNW